MWAGLCGTYGSCTGLPLSSEVGRHPDPGDRQASRRRSDHRPTDCSVGGVAIATAPLSASYRGSSPVGLVTAYWASGAHPVNTAPANPAGSSQSSRRARRRPSGCRVVRPTLDAVCHCSVIEQAPDRCLRTPRRAPSPFSPHTQGPRDGARPTWPRRWAFPLPG